MSAGIILNVDGLEIPVSVVRKRVKNLNLRVRADGTVTLSIPQHLPLARAQEFLEGQLDRRARPPQHRAQALAGLCRRAAQPHTALGKARPTRLCSSELRSGRRRAGCRRSGDPRSGRFWPGRWRSGRPWSNHHRSSRPRRALPHRSAARAARCGRAHGGPHRRPCSALERSSDENALGFVHAENRCNPHQRPIGRLSARVPGVRGGARTRAPSGAEPQRPLPRPAR